MTAGTHGRPMQARRLVESVQEARRLVVALFRHMDPEGDPPAWPLDEPMPIWVWMSS